MLGRESCIGIELIRIRDSDIIYHVSDQPALPSVVLSDHVLSKNTESLDELNGHYTIHTNPEVQPAVVHPPHN